MTKKDAPRGGYRGGLPASQVGPPAPLPSATIRPAKDSDDNTRDEYVPCPCAEAGHE